MVTPLSSDFGSCHIAVRYEGIEYEVKIYICPLLMHKLKSLDGVNTSYLNKICHIQGQVRPVRINSERVGKKTPSSKLDRYRIEVTVSAQTLFEARRIIESTEFLDVNSWIQPTKPQLQPFKLDIKAISEEQNIQNAKAMRAVAKSLPI